jgi:probable F420-dependent oxidoreductase
MDIGFGIPSSGAWATPANIADLAARAEELGYSSLWTFQRLLSPLDGDRPTLAPQYRAPHDPLALLAYLAGRTSTARLGVAVVNLPFYSPIVLAKALTTIDVLSGGRLVAGLGLGWSADEFTAAGASLAGRGRRADDFLRCLQAIWSDDVVDYRGDFYRVPRSRVDPKPVQRPGPPVLLGGGSEAALRRAGRLAGGWVSSSQADLSALGRSIEVVRAAAADAGRDPGALQFVCRGAVKVRHDQRGPLTGTLEEIRADLAGLAAQGMTEVFVDLNFDPEISHPDADPAEARHRALATLEALAPGA